MADHSLAAQQACAAETLPAVMTLCSLALSMMTCSQEVTMDIAAHVLVCIWRSSRGPDGLTSLA